MADIEMEQPDFLTRFFHLPQDPRTKDWIMVKYPSIIVWLTLGYLYFVKVWGPAYMKSRPPYDLKIAIRIYNGLNVVLSTGFLATVLRLTYLGGGYNFFCQGMTFSTDEKSLTLLQVYWWLRLLRIADYLDTVFFVLRKKFNQVSTLHVVHHCLVVFDCWFWQRIGTDGHTSFIICLNTFVHVIMYTYYFLSAFGPDMQKYLWWKRYLTQLQIVQFIIAMLHGSIPLFVDCGYPRLYVYLAMPQGVLFLYLFVQFYVNAYKERRRQEAYGMKAKTANGYSTVCSPQVGGVKTD
ncbi:elongation of very long chain fatty acids protein AAEL008004-like isoform X2 [Varroa jacobsoni]|uniref:Elongation of very long chain fatty acids protein n=2 Tax=Varroa TaxID=62624 RepID=A0A7M7KL90_VARDE|nr:elongation of very long chain fatty acids protein AAEL008004-like [Varroa destructor]XP_022665338.1 elongation of very long chain fatty acids protein AAEL008004-like [Varroa destructor]XP_022665339.1 elongation of very long chain fatty acids protein AAEL008004-like [Varroa destructor]XP_022703419.1 elongation of very long chain fatty acids protein AAEL008004-like isoform X2 [Varroa jacobsoni]XP_022703420.1 elongation of very long chain fatty acids protein AAEL008004-like isoform X2 [Varroa j